MIPMSLLKVGTFAVIERLSIRTDLLNKLIDLGIIPGAKFRVLMNNKDLVIKINEVKIAIDKALCKNIMVLEL